MFRPLRHFRIASLVGCLVVAGALGFHHRQVASEQVLIQGERHNLTLTRSLGNALEPAILALLSSSYGLSREEVKNLPAAKQLSDDLALKAQGLAIAKIKLYNLAGITLFSTDPVQIGEDQSANPGFQTARSDKVATDLVFKNKFHSFDGVLENRSVLSSYIPLHSPANGQVVGVLELYRDVTPLLAEVDRAGWRVMAGAAGGLLLLFLFLQGIVRRAEITIRNHDEERSRFLERISEHQTRLEERVRERTEQLSHTNLSLLTEVAVRRQAEAELCLASTAFQNTHEGIVITDHQAYVEWINPAFTRITGYLLEEVKGRNLSLLQSGRHDRHFYQNLWGELERSGHWSGEIWNRNKDGKVYPELLSITAIRDSEGITRQFVGVFTDISAQRESEQRIDFLAQHDALTGLPNRLLLMDRMRQAIALSDRFEQLVGILYIGLDRFKHVNDSCGHPVGDRLLKEVAERLTRITREGDSVARVGGDEFVVLATGVLQVQHIARVAGKVLEVLSQPFQHMGEEIHLGASMGVTISPFDEADPETLLRHAHSALGHAKENGGGNYQFYTSRLADVASRRLTLENRLRHALQRDEFVLYYQPQFEVATGRLCGMEALIRWMNPDLGMVSPAQFIPIAEETGLILPIGEWVLRTACHQAMLWREAGFAPVRMAVNLSARQFQQQDLPSVVSSALADTGLPAQYLELELTEGMVMQDVRVAVDMLRELKGMGVQVAIDDFGTGYSSLSYLKRFPIGTLKIDRAFVRDVVSDPDDAAIIRTIIVMARTLGMGVVAEGVASVEQLEFLRQLDCDTVQGFLFSPPVPPEEATLFLEEEKTYRSDTSQPEKGIPPSPSIAKIVPLFSNETRLRSGGRG